MKVYLAALLAMLFWGLSFVWTSIVLEYYSPITTIFLRLVLSSFFIFLLLIILGRLQKIKKRHLGLILISSIFNPFLYFIGENYGVMLTTPSVSAIMIATIPLFTPLAAWLLIKERLSVINLMGILISFAGIVIMLLNPELSFDLGSGGIPFLLMAVFSAVIYSVLLKKLTLHYKPSSIIAWQNLTGVFLFMPIFLISEYSGFVSVEPNIKLVTSLLFLAVFASSLAFILFTYTIKNLGVSRANVYSNLIPVVTAITSYFILDELFTINKIAGMLIVITGVILTQIRKIKTSHAKK